MTPLNSRRAAALALALSLPTTLSAQTPAADDPDALYQQGLALRGRRDDNAALALFQRLHDQGHETRALVQLGLVEAAVGRWVSAELHLTLALQRAREPIVASNRDALDEALTVARSHLGFLVVACETPGAEVWIDNRLSGGATEGQSHRVLSGTVSFEVRAAGHASVFLTATVPPNGRARENVPALTERAAEPAHAAPPPTVVPVAPPARSSSLRTVGVVGIIGGAVVAAGGVVAWVLGSSSVSAFNDDPDCPNINAPAQPTQCQQRIDTARTLEPLAWTGIGLGGALAVGGLALVLAAPSRAPTEARAFRCGQGPGTVGLACALAF